MKERGPKRYTLHRFPHWRLVVGSFGAFLMFTATWTWIVNRIAGWLR